MHKKALNQASDRRIPRTRQMLQHALINLILEKGYDAITVADICDAANVGRSTFYAHYTSKDDLKRSGLDHLRRLLVERQQIALAAPEDGTDRSFAFSLPLFEHARDHAHLHRALIKSSGGDLALCSIHDILSGLVRKELNAAAGGNAGQAAAPELTVQYVVGAYMAVLTWWLDGGMTLSPEQVDAQFRRLATGGVLPA